MPRKAKAVVAPDQTVVSAPIDIPAPVVKTKRVLTKYNLFFKSEYQNPEVQALPAKERCSAIAKRWKIQKNSGSVA